MSRLLRNHLAPQGLNNDGTTIPSVLDSDGVAIAYTAAKRITSEATVVDIGDAPNSNTGDPLRTSFIKINNFMEASYWANESVDGDITKIVAKINEIIAVVNAQHGTTITTL